MSTNILGELDKILGSIGESPNNARQIEDLSGLVKRLMAEKRLSLRQVAARSQGGITQGYVGGIVKGRYRNLTVDKVKALAKGLGIDEEELFTVLRTRPADKSASISPDLTYYVRILDLTKLIITEPRLYELLTLYMELPAAGRESAIRAMKVFLQDKKEETARAI